MSSSADFAHDRDGNPSGVSESTALLRHSIETADNDNDNDSVASGPQTPLPPKEKRRVLALLCAFAFTMMLGDNLQPAAITQVFETVICDDYYKTHSAVAPGPPHGDRCQVPAVQKELALVRGFQQMAPLLPGLLCTVPYGLLADRVGRKRVLILSGAGVTFALCWVMLVCYLRFAPLRWVLFSGAFLFIGGGDAVTSSVLHVMVTDTTTRAERAQVFLYLHAADVVSGFFGPAISGALMEAGYTWLALLLAALVLFSGTFILSYFIPETLHLANEVSGEPSDHPRPGDSLSSAPGHKKGKKKHILSTISTAFAPLLGVLRSNRQGVLLLAIFAPQTSARELFTVIGLQYSKAKFALSYARGNVLLSLFQGAQGMFVLVLLPALTRAVAEPRGWSDWTRDRRYAIASIAGTALGLLVIAAAPVLAVELIGLLLVSLGSCTTGLLMSLLGGVLKPGQVSALYSTALMLSMVSRSITAPVVSALLTAGMDLGWAWMGLPFAVMAILMAGIAVASGFIQKKKPEHTSED